MLSDLYSVALNIKPDMSDWCFVDQRGVRVMCVLTSPVSLLTECWWWREGGEEGGGLYSGETAQHNTTHCTPVITVILCGQLCRLAGHISCREIQILRIKQLPVSPPDQTVRLSDPVWEEGRREISVKPGCAW